MSILESLFGGLFGDDGDDAQEAVVEHPCSNCPSKCSIAPNACSVCQPYKEQMIDAIYWVEHKDELISKYEVTGTAVSQGAVVCPHCGGHSDNPYVCDYCGSRLQEGTGKIQVASASEIPNPILEAQNIIFDRYDAVKDFPGADEAYGLVDALSGIGSQGLLSSIFDALLGASDENDSKTIGNKMTESEIKEMAEYYKVSVAEYLTGLDNGKYLTLSNKKTAAAAEEQYSQSNTSSYTSGSLSDLSGLGGAIGLGSLLFGGSSYNYNAARPEQYKPGTYSYQTGSSAKPPQTGSNTRPPQYSGQGFPEPPAGMHGGHHPGQPSGPQGSYQKPQSAPQGTYQKPQSSLQGSYQSQQSKPQVTISKPARKPSMPTSPAQKTPQSAKPARTPSDMNSARKQAANTVSKPKTQEEKISQAMKKVSDNKSQAQKKTQGNNKK